VGRRLRLREGGREGGREVEREGELEVEREGGREGGLALSVVIVQPLPMSSTTFT
jgi:hypothetical protein